jgi:broad specificity polyphosphatase/5'/3'-nucleotidase SurE
MNNDLLKYISEYFNTFSQKDYTIYVDGTPTECCKLNSYDYVVWNIPSDSNESDWYSINVCEIEAIRLTPTTMEIVKTNGKEYTFVAKLKSKEKKVKDIILRTKNALNASHIDDALDYLDELKALLDE